MDGALADDVLAGVRVGRIVALRKVGDVLRRLATLLTQRFAPQLQKACLLLARLQGHARAEAVACLLRAGIFDRVSRRAMLRGLFERPSLRPLWPHARRFYADSSSMMMSAIMPALFPPRANHARRTLPSDPTRGRFRKFCGPF